MEKFIKLTLTFFFGFILLFVGKVIFAKPNLPINNGTNVKTVVIAPQDWQKKVIALGSLLAPQGIMVTPEAAGQITNIYFKSGQLVKKGDKLLQLNADFLVAQLQKQKAQTDLSQIEYERTLKLYEQKVYNKSNLDQAKTNLASANAAIDEILAQMKQLTVVAPFDGKLGLRKVSVGDYLVPGTPIVSLQQLNPLLVDFSMPEKYLAKIDVGTEVNIRISAIKRTYTGKITAVNSLVDAQTRTIDIRAIIQNDDHKLLPGMFAEVYMFVGGVKKEIIIPQTAITYSADGEYVYTVVDKKAHKVYVKLGEKLTDNRVIVKKGLKAGDVMVIAGQMKLSDGDNVITTDTK